jgi:hypothetical protein
MKKEEKIKNKKNLFLEFKNYFSDIDTFINDFNDFIKKVIKIKYEDADDAFSILRINEK